MKSFIPRALVAASLALAIARAPADSVAVLTFHYDNTRQGANTNETSLTLANVNVNHFGKLFAYKVDGYLYAEPLLMTNVSIPGHGTRNLVLVATQHDSVYAFDADSNAGADGGLVWQTNLGTSAPLSPDYGARYHREGNTDMVPEDGITGTPVIDPATGTLYVNVFTREGSGPGANYFHHLHALDLATGHERPYSPVLVTASVPGTGPDSVNGVVSFHAKQHLGRPALTLAGGILYASYGSHADTDPYHGWVIGFNPANLEQLTNYVFNTTPNATQAVFGGNAGEGGLWMGGGGLAVDAGGNLYLEVANGSFSANTGGGDYGDSFVKLTTAGKLAVADYFTPYDQAKMQSSDNDLGSGAPMLLPESVGSAAHPRLLVGAGKPGIIHLLDCDNLGHFNAANDRQIVQEIHRAIGGGGSFATPAYFNNHIYYTGRTDNVKAFAIANGVITPQPTSASPTALGPFTGSPVISADGTNNGIVWVVDPGAYDNRGAAVLHAYNADNLAQELYNSSRNLARDNPGGAVKMTAPTVANGKVYVGAEYQLSVYGTQNFLATPRLSPNGGAFTNQVTVTLAGASLGAGIYYTLDGSAPTAASRRYDGPFVLRESAQIQAVAIKPGAVRSVPASALFVNRSAGGNGTGLKGEYYANTTGADPFQGAPFLTRTDATVDFIGKGRSYGDIREQTNLAVRWTGAVQPRYAEIYSFSDTGDGSVRLWVNGQLLIDNWGAQTAAEVKSNTITLASQQLYNLELDYYQKIGIPSLHLEWNSPSTPLTIIPPTQLYPYTNPPPTVTLLTPTNNASYTASASVTMVAQADAPHNPIAEVAFYASGTLLGRVSQPPYALTATGLEAGTYALTAVATDGSGLCRTSAPVNIKVMPGSGQPYGLTTREIAPAYLNMPATFDGALPLLLSETGVFSDTPSMAPASGLIPYAPNSPLWSDRAEATCYFAVPNRGGVATPGEQISFSLTGSWSFPPGTVFAKTLELQTDQAHAKVKRRLETQLLVRDANGQAYGVTYKWRADRSDADLLVTSRTENISITNASGVSVQSWYYASPADCRLCHTPAAHYVLGVNTRQLNGRHTYAATAVVDNQLRALNHLGLLNPALDESDLAHCAEVSAVTKAQASVEQRARSYLDVNCAQCHRPGGFGIFDARYDTPLPQQNLVNVVAAFNLGQDHAHFLTPKDLKRSVIYNRMNSLDPAIKMPLVGRNLIDTNAVELMGAWINSLPFSPEITIPTNGIGRTNIFE